MRWCALIGVFVWRGFWANKKYARVCVLRLFPLVTDSVKLSCFSLSGGQACLSVKAPRCLGWAAVVCAEADVGPARDQFGGVVVVVYNTRPGHDHGSIVIILLFFFSLFHVCTECLLYVDGNSDVTLHGHACCMYPFQYTSCLPQLAVIRYHV